MLLCIFLAAIAGAVMLWIIRPLVGWGGGAVAPDHAARAALYRDALTGLGEDRAQALIAPAEAGAERAALARALIAETVAETVVESAAEEAQTASSLPRWVAYGLAVLLPLNGLAAYFMTGMNQGRPSFMAYSADAHVADLARQLADAVVRHPQDPEGRRLQGVTEAARGHYAEAARHFGEALALGARTANTLTDYGEMLSMAAGRPTQEAIAAFDEALTREPDAIRTRIDRAEARFALGQFAGAAEDLRAVLASAPEGSPWTEPLKARIAAAERATKADAIATQSPDAQAAMIEGMVDGLAQKLDADPKNLPGWTRLVHAYVVLGQRDKAAAALAKARDVFAGDASAKPVLDEAEQELR
jgi:cytochrome c-type biogenesis protein CcmH